MEGRRTYPDKDVKPETILFKIVASKVSNIYKKWRRLQARLRKEPPNPEADQKEAVIGGKVEYIDFGFDENGLVNALTPVQTPSLRRQILVLVADDSLLVRMVGLQLNALGNQGKPLKARAMAQKLGVSVQSVYNANRRLKAKLKKYRPVTRLRSIK